jgi:RHS repeat-associated protein
MPRLDTASIVTIPSPITEEVVLTTRHIPGLEVRIPPGTVITDEDGQVVTSIGITPIPVNRPPFPLPRGVDVPIYFTVQPGGAYIAPHGARLIYPNYRNKPPGTRTTFWSYDPEAKGWYIYGQGTVTPDGRQVVPDPAVAVYEFTGAMINDPEYTPPESGPPPHPDQKPPDSSPTPEGGGSPIPEPNPDDGEPVDLSMGLFVLEKTDLFLPDTLPIMLTRTYRPEDNQSRSFGIGTTFPYDLFLFSAQPFQEADLILPDGGRVHYVRISPGVGFEDAEFEHTTTPTAFYRSRIKWNGNGWDLSLKDGTVYVFGTMAPLNAIRDRYGNKVTIARARVNQFGSPTGNITQIRSPNGRWLEFTYDANNRISQAKDNIGRVVTYTYDASGRLSSVTDANGGVTEYTYDAFHRMRTIKDARGIVFLTNEYDASGRVIKQTLADGGTYQFAYTVDANGKITQTLVTDPRGNIRRVTFNDSGYILTDTRALGTPEEQTTTYEREAGTNLVLSMTDPLGRKTAHTYDAMGNVTAITRLAGTPEAVTTAFAYEPKFNQMAVGTDPLGHTITFAYDEKGNLITLTDALSHSATLTYNPDGQPVSITDALGHVAQLTYDLGIRSGMTDPLGATATRYIDSAGRPITLTDPLGHATTQAYDAHNRLTQATDPLRGVTAFAYDPNGNLLSLTDARGSVTSYTYDDMDRLASRTDPLGRSESYERDVAGNLTRFTDRKGQVTTFTYDALNRLRQVTYADGSTITYTYDAGNRLTQVVDSVSGTVTLTYDNLDRLTAEATPQGTVSYTYDVVGRRTSMTVQGQPPVTYTYDDVNRLTEITQGATAVAIGYDAAGRPTRLTLPGEVVVEFSYDAASQLTRITYKRTEGMFGDLTYQYDPAGNRIKTDGSFARTAVPEAIASFAYDAANRLLQRGTIGLTYDDNGNLTSDGVRTYTWDARNRLASISGPGIAASFGYDAFGRRIRTTINGTTSAFLYDALNTVQEIAGGTPVANLLAGPGIDAYFIRTDVNGAQTLLFDALGSTLGLLDANGVLQTEYAYEPFGATTATGTASPNPFQYTGRENDATGLYYYRARYYSPTLQRFISEDPRGFAGGDMNLYAYALSSPTNFTDPLGLSVDVWTVVDFLNTIRQARERQKQMETSGRGSCEDPVEGVKSGINEVLRTYAEILECLSPVPFMSGATSGGNGPGGGGTPPGGGSPGGGDTPPGGGGPFRTPGERPETPREREIRRRWEELLERLRRRRWWRRR